MSKQVTDVCFSLRYGEATFVFWVDGKFCGKNCGGLQNGMCMRRYPEHISFLKKDEDRFLRDEACIDRFGEDDE